MKSEFLIPIIDTALSSAKVLMVALEMLKAALLNQEPQQQRCEHKQRSDESTSGIKRWRCLDCGHIEEKEI